MQTDLSVVVPVYNEAPNLVPLWEEIQEALAASQLNYEAIFVDDGSCDESFAILKRLHHEDNRLKIIQLRRNTGQTAAFAAGFDAAQGDVIITMDADRQNDPADMPALLAKLEEGYDVVNGWRQHRQDGLLLRKIPSRIANQLIARATGVKLRDRGCSMRAFRRQVVKELRMYGEMHRFIPELVNSMGFSMTETAVNHRPRMAGDSKYGLSRTFRVILDLITIIFLRRYSDRPMYLFGALGIIFGGVGGAAVSYLIGAKLLAGLRGGMAGFEAYQIGSRPMLLLGVLLVIMGMQFLLIGLLAELLVRTYFESQNKPIYQIKQALPAASDPPR